MRLFRWMFLLKRARRTQLCQLVITYLFCLGSRFHLPPSLHHVIRRTDVMRLDLEITKNLDKRLSPTKAMGWIIAALSHLGGKKPKNLRYKVQILSMLTQKGKQKRPMIYNFLVSERETSHSFLDHEQS